MRRCYICGREAYRRTIVEPLMLPVCLERECGQVAAQLRALHCTARASDGRLCGAPSAPHVELEGHHLCGAHLRAQWALETCAA